eukprot:9753845-Alexandrium_andersonii.AAC.1
MSWGSSRGSAQKVPDAGHGCTRQSRHSKAKHKMADACAPPPARGPPSAGARDRARRPTASHGCDASGPAHRGS